VAVETLDRRYHRAHARVRWLSEVLGCAIADEVIPVGEGVGVVRRTARVRMHRFTVPRRDSAGR
jgi:hypothetical protein